MSLPNPIPFGSLRWILSKCIYGLIMVRDVGELVLAEAARRAAGTRIA